MANFKSTAETSNSSIKMLTSFSNSFSVMFHLDLRSSEVKMFSTESNILDRDRPK